MRYSERSMWDGYHLLTEGYERGRFSIKNRELKQRWRRREWERPKRKAMDRLILAKTHLCTCITLFCTFLSRRCTTTTWKCLISRFVGDGNTRQQLPFSFPELWCSPLEFNSKTFANIWWIKRDGISAITFEAARIHFASDVFVAVAVVVAYFKLPNGSQSQGIGSSYKTALNWPPTPLPWYEQ